MPPPNTSPRCCSSCLGMTTPRRWHADTPAQGGCHARGNRKKYRQAPTRWRAAAHHSGALFGDHDGRRVGIGRGDGWYDRGVDDSEGTRCCAPATRRRRPSLRDAPPIPPPSTSFSPTSSPPNTERSCAALHSRTADPAARGGAPARLRSAMRSPPQLASLGDHAIPRPIGLLEAGQLGCFRFPPY
jgi:hypothetical protein